MELAQGSLPKAQVGSSGHELTSPRMAQMIQLRSHQCLTDPSEFHMRLQEGRNPIGFW